MSIEYDNTAVRQNHIVDVYNVIAQLIAIFDVPCTMQFFARVQFYEIRDSLKSNSNWTGHFIMPFVGRPKSHMCFICTYMNTFFVKYWSVSHLVGLVYLSCVYLETALKKAYLALFLTSSSLTGLAQNPCLVTKSGQAYFGKFEDNVAGSTLVTPILKAPDQSDSSGLPITKIQYNSPSSNVSWLQK